MTLLRETPKDHGILLDHDPRGQRRLPITLAGKSPSKNGRRLQHATGDLYNRCFQHASTNVWNHSGQRLQSQDQAGKQNHPITEEAVTQIRLLLDALGQTDKPKQAERLACAIADMHPCESNWWYACTQNRSRPSRVLDALTLMYS